MYHTSSRPVSYLSPLPVNTLSTNDPLAAPRPRSSLSASSHYRPFSTIVQRPSTADGHFARPTSNVFTPSRGVMASYNRPGTDRGSLHPQPSAEPVQRLRKDSDPSPPQSRLKDISKSIKKKRSFVQLFHLGTTISPAAHTTIGESSTPTTPTIEIVPDLACDSSSGSSDHSPSSTSPRPPHPLTSTDDRAPMQTAKSIKQVPGKADQADDESTAGYKPKDTWMVNRLKSKVHPYVFEDAPYMRSYEPMDLENDRYNDILLRRLYPKGSPTFQEWGNNHPAKVLDVGCGAGHWMYYAATKWPETEFCGLDMVDVLTPSVTYKGNNIMLLRGNFVKYPWQVPTSGFDLVRICDLSLAIPYEQWIFVISEARRALRRGGRLELIDDQVIFPDGTEPTPSHSVPPICASISEDTSTRKGTSFFDMDSDDDSDISDDDSAENSVGGYSSTEPSTSVDERSPCPPLVRFSLSEPTRRRPPPPTRPLPPNPTSTTRPVAPQSSWALRMQEAVDLERCFEKMLADRCKMYPRPAHFLRDLLEKVFDSSNCERPQSKHLKLAPPGLATNGISVSKPNVDTIAFGGEDPMDSNSAATSASSSSGKRKWIPKRNARKDQADPDRPSLETRSSNDSAMPVSPPENVSAKAAGRLGISFSDVSTTQKQRALHPTGLSFASTLKSVPKTSTQSPGLLVWPQTFIPCSPAELEMHACKHMHTLIGCKLGLLDFMRSWQDSITKEKLDVTDEQLLDSLWDYENFRRARFNWPLDIPSSHCASNEPFELPSISISVTYPGRHPKYLRPPPPPPPGSRKEPGPFGWNELTHIRSIRVFSAVKGPKRGSTGSDTPTTA